MVSPSRQRKYQAKLGPTPAEMEHDRLLGVYEENPNKHRLLCLPSNLPQFDVLDGGIDGPYNEKVLKIPAFGRLFEGKGQYRYDAYARHIWSEQECEQAVKTLNLYGNICSNIDEWQSQNLLHWERGRRKAQSMFFKGGKLPEEHERYHPSYNDPICKHFISQCISRTLETMNCPHGQKISAVGLMLTAWFVPKIEGGLNGSY